MHGCTNALMTFAHERFIFFMSRMFYFNVFFFLGYIELYRNNEVGGYGKNEEVNLILVT